MSRLRLSLLRLLCLACLSGALFGSVLAAEAERQPTWASLTSAQKQAILLFADWAKKEVAQTTPAEAPKGITEEAISEKTRLGLTRAQAIEILTTQAAHDAQLETEGKKKGKA